DERGTRERSPRQLGRLAGSLLRHAVRRRQVDAEGCTMARLALDLDGAADLTNDAPYGAQAQAGALAALLRREERLEDAVVQLGWNAGSRVGHGEQHPSSGGVVSCRECRGVGPLDCNADPALPVHR